MRLSKSDKHLLFRLALGSSTTTAVWRPYVALSNRGLVKIDDEGRAWGRLFGVETRALRLTLQGREALEIAMRDVPLWHPTANRHAIEALAKVTPDRPRVKKCLCDACHVAWLMRPNAA